MSVSCFYTLFYKHIHVYTCIMAYTYVNHIVIPHAPFPKMHSIFDSNLSLEDLRDTSALTAFRFPVYLFGKNIFIRNVGGGIDLISTRLQAEGELLFINNTAKFGGGIAMYDHCRVSITGCLLN